MDVVGFERLLEQEEMTTLLDSSKIVIATIALKGNELIEWIKQRNDCPLVMVTERNRDRLTGVLVTEVLRTLKGTEEVGR